MPNGAFSIGDQQCKDPFSKVHYPSSAYKSHSTHRAWNTTELEVIHPTADVAVVNEVAAKTSHIGKHRISVYSLNIVLPICRSLMDHAQDEAVT